MYFQISNIETSVLPQTEEIGIWHVVNTSLKIRERHNDLLIMSKYKHSARIIRNGHYFLNIWNSDNP